MGSTAVMYLLKSLIIGPSPPVIGYVLRKIVSRVLQGLLIKFENIECETFMRCTDRT